MSKVQQKILATQSDKIKLYNKQIKPLKFKPSSIYPEIVNKQGQQEISKEEGAWLIDTAKQEYFFKNDRNKIFNNE